MNLNAVKAPFQFSRPGHIHTYRAKIMIFACESRSIAVLRITLLLLLLLLLFFRIHISKKGLLIAHFEFGLKIRICCEIVMKSVEKDYQSIVEHDY